MGVDKFDCIYVKQSNNVGFEVKVEFSWCKCISYIIMNILFQEINIQRPL